MMCVKIIAKVVGVIKEKDAKTVKNCFRRVYNIK